MELSAGRIGTGGTCEHIMLLVGAGTIARTEHRGVFSGVMGVRCFVPLCFDFPS